jgi:hypothetical protein
MRGTAWGVPRAMRLKGTPGTFKAIGLVEVLGGVGMFLPALLDIAPILVPTERSFAYG